MRQWIRTTLTVWVYAATLTIASAQSTEGIRFGVVGAFNLDMAGGLTSDHGTDNKLGFGGAFGAATSYRFASKWVLDTDLVLSYGRYKVDGIYCIPSTLLSTIPNKLNIRADYDRFELQIPVTAGYRLTLSDESTELQFGIGWFASMAMSGKVSYTDAILSQYDLPSKAYGENGLFNRFNTGPAIKIGFERNGLGVFVSGRVGLTKMQRFDSPHRCNLGNVAISLRYLWGK